jgi:hypothetical protein
MKGIDSTCAPLVLVPGWVEVKAILRIAYSNQKHISNINEAIKSIKRKTVIIGYFNFTEIDYTSYISPKSQDFFNAM